MNSKRGGPSYWSVYRRAKKRTVCDFVELTVRQTMEPLTVLKHITKLLRILITRTSVLMRLTLNVLVTLILFALRICLKMKYPIGVILNGPCLMMEVTAM